MSISLGGLLILYCMLSFVLFTIEFVYFMKCICNKSYCSKQPILWKSGSIMNMILFATLTWLPVLIVKCIIETFKY